jgi:hypothetical protein
MTKHALRLCTIVALCNVIALPLRAATGAAACGIVVVDNSAIYTFVAQMTFTYSDPGYLYGDGFKRIDGTHPFSEYWEHQFAKPMFGWSDDYSESDYFETSPYQGGCDTPSIEFHSDPPYFLERATGSMACWSARYCYLTVEVNTDGQISPGGGSGWYLCTDSVTLTATPLNGYDWVEWSGDVSSTNQTITVYMGYSNRYETANFIRQPPPPPPPGGGDDRGSGCQYPSGETCTPIIFNLGNGGYRLTGADNPVVFDINATGRPLRIGWTAPGENEAFLWLDRNRNGSVDDGSELFGTSTRLHNGQRAENGFIALAESDANHDGVIDGRDPIWNSLSLWYDYNHDGITQSGETESIGASSITEIGLSYHWTGRADQSGNMFRYEGRLKEGNRTRPFYDIFFVAVP